MIYFKTPFKIVKFSLIITSSNTTPVYVLLTRQLYVQFVIYLQLFAKLMCKNFPVVVYEKVCVWFLKLLKKVDCIFISFVSNQSRKYW